MAAADSLMGLVIGVLVDPIWSAAAGPSNTATATIPTSTIRPQWCGSDAEQQYVTERK